MGNPKLIENETKYLISQQTRCYEKKTLAILIEKFYFIEA